MPGRVVREGILTSEPVNSLSWAGEVFYRRLMSVVDDFGRYYAKPTLLRAACYPLLLNKVSDSDVGKWLTECVNAALVRVYPALDGKRYLEILKFDQRMRASVSKFPACDGQLSDACQTSAHVIGSGIESGSVNVIAPDGARTDEKPPPRKSDKACRLPSDWRLPDAWRDWAIEAHGIDAQRAVRISLGFRDYWLGVPGTKGVKLDWEATWRNWVRKEIGDA